MDELLNTTEVFITDIRIEFGITKCKTLHIEGAQWTVDQIKRTLQNEILDSTYVQTRDI